MHGDIYHFKILYIVFFLSKNIPVLFCEKFFFLALWCLKLTPYILLCREACFIIYSLPHLINFVACLLKNIRSNNLKSRVYAVYIFL